MVDHFVLRLFLLADRVKPGTPVMDDGIEVRALVQDVTDATLLPAHEVLARWAQGLRDRFAQAAAGGWFAGIFAIESQPSFKTLDTLLHRSHLRRQVFDSLHQRPQQPDQIVLARG